MTTPTTPERIDGVSTRLLDGEQPLPLVLSPDDDKAVRQLPEWLASHADFLRERLPRHGAILLRGFDIPDPRAFEAVARAITPNLKIGRAHV